MMARPEVLCEVREYGCEGVWVKECGGEVRECGGEGVGMEVR